MTKLLSVVKEELQLYCDKVYSRSDNNQIWIHINSKYLLDNLNSRNFSKTFDFSILCATIPHHKLKTCLQKIIHKTCFFKNGRQRYKVIFLGHNVLCQARNERQKVLYRKLSKTKPITEAKAFNLTFR